MSTILRRSRSIAGLAVLAVVASSVTPLSAWAEGAGPGEPSRGESDADLAELMIALDSAEAAERCDAVRRLGASGASGVLPRVAERLRIDESDEVRLEAATVLGDVGDEDVAAALHESATSDESERVRSGAWIGLVRVGSRVGTTVVLPMIVDTLLHHARSSVRIDAARALVGLADEAALGHLAAAAATDPVQTVRVAARVAHGELGRALDLSDAQPIDLAPAGPQLDPERPPSRAEPPRERRPGTALLISGGVLAGLGLAAGITGFALLPGSDDLRFSIGLGLGIPGVLVAVTGVVLIVVGVLRRFAPEERSPRPGPALVSSLGIGPTDPAGLPFGASW